MRGDALSCVIIDKLPFTSPDDPLLKARIEDCRLRGGDPFNDVQLPDAVITLKQGVGRLIRDIDDRGVLVICDNRLVMRPYGAMFLNSLPPGTPDTGSGESHRLSQAARLKVKKSGVCYYARPVNTYLFPAEVGMSTRILAIDTATEACSVALWNNGEVQALFELCPREHTQRILPMVQQILASSGLSLQQLDALAFGRGPGSFTGVRIGIGIGQGLALGANLPMIGVSTLQTMAQGGVSSDWCHTGLGGDRCPHGRGLLGGV